MSYKMLVTHEVIMSQINWRKVRTGLNKTLFTRHFWEGADIAFAEACKLSKETARQVFGLEPSEGRILVRISESGVTVEDSKIGHRAKRAILRKVGRFLRDDRGRQLKLSNCEEHLQWREDPAIDTDSEAINEADLEYLGWSIVAKTSTHYSDYY